MRDPGGFADLLVVGPGRLGLAFGWELWKATAVSTLRFHGRSPSPPSHPVFAEMGVVYIDGELRPDPPPTVVLFTVPDHAIEPAAARLALAGLPPSVVLHTSGVMDSSVLSPLGDQGWATGSIHPLVAIADAVESAPKLRGAWFGIEGAEDAKTAAGAMVSALGGHPLQVTADGKPGYHAAAVLASNYVVAALRAAVRMITRSGVPDAEAIRALSALAWGAVEDVNRLGPEAALTGPILRGDLRTIELHLGWLSPEERVLYSVLGREAVEIARRRGLAPDTAERIIEILEAGST